MDTSKYIQVIMIIAILLNLILNAERVEELE